MTYSLPTDHVSLADDPPVAATQSGGPKESPGLLVKPKKFQYDVSIKRPAWKVAEVQVVQGFFMQNGPKPKAHDFEYMVSTIATYLIPPAVDPMRHRADQKLRRSFGMVDQSSDRWANLKRDVAKLQDEATAGVQYKVFFLARHGQGAHNYAVLQVGVQPWESYWAFQYGHTELGLAWGPDPELTDTGIQQAIDIHTCWKDQLPLGAPIGKEEMKWYVSPLTRTAQTMQYSWGDMLEGQPEVWEDWREIYGSHTCDQRRSRSYIAERYPDFKIEESLTENDELWKPDMRESNEHLQIRGQRALDRVFSEGGAKETYISVTAHSENLRNILAVLGHQPFPLATGEMIPVVVRATPMPLESDDDDKSTSSGSCGCGGSTGTSGTGGTGGTGGQQSGSDDYA